MTAALPMAEYSFPILHVSPEAPSPVQIVDCMPVRTSLSLGWLLVLLLTVAIGPGLAWKRKSLERSEIPLRRRWSKLHGRPWRPARWTTPSFLLEGVEPSDENMSTIWTFCTARSRWRGATGTTAIARFRAMIARNPDLPRVRLDLALAYFQAGEDGNAARHFRLALGTKDLPPVVRARALAFLDAIRRRKSWSITGSLAVLPDSNINAATSARQIELFGLPASLSEDARQTSGVGVSANVSGGYEARISPDLRFRVGGGLRTRTYREDQFNERTVNLRAGPRFLFDKFDLRPEVTARQRRLGGDAYSRALGIELSGNWLIGPTWRLGGSLGRERIYYETFLGDGYIDSAGLNLSHALGRATQLQADTAYRREKLDEDGYSWREFLIGVSASREFPQGVRVERRADLPLAGIRRAAGIPRPRRAARPDARRADHGLQPEYRAVWLHAGGHAPL